MVQPGGDLRTVQELFPEFCRNVGGDGFFIFDLEIPRLSGNSDIIPVTISERIITDEMLKVGKKLLVKGQFRSYNSYVNEKNKLILTVFAKFTQF